MGTPIEHQLHCNTLESYNPPIYAIELFRVHLKQGNMLYTDCLFWGHILCQTPNYIHHSFPPGKDLEVLDQIQGINRAFDVFALTISMG